MTGRTFLIFGDDWERHPQTLEHIARVLARTNRVIWVNSLGHRRPQLTVKDLRRVVEKLRAAVRPAAPRAAQTSVRVIRPLGIPFHDVKLVRQLNAWLLERFIRPVLREERADRVILLTNSPVIVDLLGRLGESVCAYYCLDDYGAFEGSLRSMRQLEEEVLKKSHVAFFVSQQLFDNRPMRPAHSAVITQGVDVDHFASASAGPQAPLGHLPRPVVGFMGLIAPWVDVPLVAEMARLRPDWSFVMVGRSAVDLSPYRAIPNLHFTGGIPFEKLPLFAGSFDAGLIPFKINPLTLASNPLKLFEYFALGIPVVSTPLPEVERFRPDVDIAATASEAVTALLRRFGTEDQTGEERRRTVAREHSWELVTERQMKLVEAAERSMTTAGRREEHSRI